MNPSNDATQPEPSDGLLRGDEAARTRYFKEALDDLERLWKRKPEPQRASDDDVTTRS